MGEGKGGRRGRVFVLPVRGLKGGEVPPWALEPETRAEHAGHVCSLAHHAFEDSAEAEESLAAAVECARASGSRVLVKRAREALGRLAAVRAELRELEAFGDAVAARLEGK